MKTSPDITELMLGLINAQKVLKNPTKTESAQAGTRTYQYFDLAGLREHSAVVLAQHNLAIVQTCDYDDHGNFVLYTRLYHKSGQWMESRFPLPTGVKSQDIGAAMTYARRYSWAAMIGLHGDKDTDGKEGTVPTVAPAFRRTTPRSGTPEPYSRHDPGPPPDEVLMNDVGASPLDHLKKQLEKNSDLEEMELWWGDVTPARNNQLNADQHAGLFADFMTKGCNVANNGVELSNFWLRFAAPREALAKRNPTKYEEIERLYKITMGGFNLGSG